MSKSLLHRSLRESSAAPARLPGRTLRAATLGLVLSVALGGALVACGGTDAPAPAPELPTLPPLPPSGGALVEARAGDVLAYVSDRLDTRAAWRGARESLAPVFGAGGATDVVAVPAIGAADAAPPPGTPRSGTVLQEAGVDEDDLLKTDGTLLVALARPAGLKTGEAYAEVQLHARNADGSLQRLSRTVLSGEADQSAYAEGLYHAADHRTVAVLSQTLQYHFIDFCGAEACIADSLLPFAPRVTREQVWIDLLDLADPAAPVLGPRLRLDGGLIGSRRIGQYLYVVTRHRPVLPLDLLPPGEAGEPARAQLAARLKATDVLPTRQRGSAAPELLTPETDCFLQTDNASLDLAITNITVLDLAQGGRPVGGRCFVGGSETVYLSADSLYLATSRYAYDFMAALPRFAEGMQTDLHKFALDGAALSYRGSGSVPGHLDWDAKKSPLRLSEHRGDLRVLTHTAGWGWVQPLDGAVPTGVPPSPARLSILREVAGERRLAVIAQLPNEKRPQALGKPGEQVYAVRFAGDRGYVVTFRRIDPLYVLDLSDPSDPRSVGEVEAAGYSDMLFPIGTNLLLGVGKDASAQGVVGGVKVAVFDVADPARPREVDQRVFGRSGSVSGLDFSRHGIDLHTVGNTLRIGLPILTIDDASFSARTRGLQRLEVDLASGALKTLPLLAPATVNPNTFSLQDDRSVQIGTQLYYWAEQAFAVQAW